MCHTGTAPWVLKKGDPRNTARQVMCDLEGQRWKRMLFLGRRLLVWTEDRAEPSVGEGGEEAEGPSVVTQHERESEIGAKLSWNKKANIHTPARGATDCNNTHPSPLCLLFSLVKEYVLLEAQSGNWV